MYLLLLQRTFHSELLQVARPTDRTSPGGLHPFHWLLQEAKRLGFHTQKWKSSGGVVRTSYEGHTGLYGQQVRCESHGQGGNKGYVHYHNCGQGNGRGGHAVRT